MRAVKKRLKNLENVFAGKRRIWLPVILAAVVLVAVALTIIEYIKPQFDNQPNNYWSCDGSVNFESPDDVLLSIHCATYLAGAEKLYGVWNIYIRFFDTYDFNYHDWSDIIKMQRANTPNVIK